MIYIFVFPPRHLVLGKRPGELSPQALPSWRKSLSVLILSYPARRHGKKAAQLLLLVVNRQPCASPRTVPSFKDAQVRVARAPQEVHLRARLGGHCSHVARYGVAPCNATVAVTASGPSTVCRTALRDRDGNPKGDPGLVCTLPPTSHTNIRSEPL